MERSVAVLVLQVNIRGVLDQKTRNLQISLGRRVIQGRGVILDAWLWLLWSSMIMPPYFIQAIDIRPAFKQQSDGIHLPAVDSQM